MHQAPLPPDEQSRRFGNLFIVAAWLSALLLLTLLFGGILEWQENPNRTPATIVGPDGSNSVVLRRNRRGHYVTAGYINGRAVRFIVDTGATDVVVPSGLADALGLERGAHAWSRTASGVVSVRRTRLDSVRVGDIELSGVDASILGSMPGSDVLLGMSFLKEVELIQQGEILTIRR